MHINPTTNKVLTFISRNKLFDKNDKCLLAVSGGVDSTALFHLFLEIRKLLEIEIGVAHVNYHLRGRDSVADELYVRSLAERYSIEIYLHSESLAAKKEGLENAAREIRYAFFKRVAEKYGFNKVVLAHNANDQAETLLLKLIRGSVSGLKGIEAVRDFSCKDIIPLLVRPLLCLSRADIEGYCSENGLQPRQDLSNFENLYTRNRIRNTILPLITAENPNFLETVQQMSTVLSQEDKYLQSAAGKIYQNSLIRKESGMIIFSHDIVRNEPEFMIRRIIKAAYEDLTGDIKSLSFKHLEEIKNNIEKNTSGKLIELPGNYFFTKDRDYLILSYGKPDFSIPVFSYELSQGENFISETGITLKVEKNRLQVGNDSTTLPDNFRYGLTARNYSPEIIFIPKGKKNSIKLKEYLDKKKIPDLERKKLILVLYGESLIWVTGIARTGILSLPLQNRG